MFDMFKILVFPTTNELPRLYHIQEGQWVITTYTAITFQVNCPDGQSVSIKIKLPLAVIRLKNGCNASSRELIVPPYYYKKSFFQIMQPTFKIASNISLWTYQTMTELVTKLRHFLNHARSLQHATQRSRHPWYVYFAIVMVLPIS
jgi:hypothetical protein